jgi:DNA adenine methylase
MINSLVRYPGGKGKLATHIVARLLKIAESIGPTEYREPFFGGGAVGLTLLATGKIGRAWLNDGDPAMSALWKAVVRDPMGLWVFVHILPEAMRLFPGTDYYAHDTTDLRAISRPSHVRRYPRSMVAAKKLAVHQVSFSGLGTMSGGPMTDRLSRYNVDQLGAKIDMCHDVISSVKLRYGTCTCLDFERLFARGNAFFYLDPPYVKAGPDLYQFAFASADHERLAKRLRGESRPWLLSYDDHPLIHQLYGGWGHIEQVSVGCSINGCRRTTELLISNRKDTADD